MVSLHDAPRHMDSPALTTVSRAPSTLSTQSKNSTVSDGSTIRKDALRLYVSEELPSLYAHPGFDLSDTGGIPLQSAPSIEDSNTVDWDGADDSTRPINWPVWKKSVNFGCLFLMCLLSSFASTISIPATQSSMSTLSHPRPFESSFSITTYILGHALGPLLILPMSEISGHYIPYCLCNIIFTIFSWRCAEASSWHVLCIYRFVAGVGGGGIFALAPASIADLVAEEWRAILQTLVTFAYMLGPALGPVFGSFATAAWGWRWMFNSMAIAGAAVTFLGACCLWETHGGVLLGRKTKLLRRETHNLALRARGGGDGMGQRLGKKMFEALRMVCTREVFWVAYLPAVAYVALYTLYITLPTTFRLVYEWDSESVGRVYLGSAVGVLFGAGVSGLLGTVVLRREAKKGDRRPETLLLPAILLMPLVTVGLAVYGWTAQKQTFWIWPIVGIGFSAAGVTSTILLTDLYIMAAHPTHTTSALAAALLVRSIFGGFLPVFLSSLLDSFGVKRLFMALALLVLLLTPLLWFYYRPRATWERKSRLKEEPDEERALGAVATPGLASKESA